VSGGVGGGVASGERERGWEEWGMGDEGEIREVWDGMGNEVFWG